MSNDKTTGVCETCGSEIEATLNMSFFGDGECGGCESQRYRRHADLLATVITIRNWTESLDYDDDDSMTELSEKIDVLDDIRDLAYEAVNHNADFREDVPKPPNRERSNRR